MKAYHKNTNGSSAYKFEYDFFEKDHLGNIRMVLTQQKDTANYLASSEAAYRSTELQLFGNITTTCYPWPSVPGYSSIPTGTLHLVTNSNDSVSKVDYNGTSGQKTGPNLLLKVMSGDTITIGVQAYYNTGSGGTNNSSFSDVLTSLANGLFNTTGGAHGNLTQLEQSSSKVYTGLTSFLGADDTVKTGYPKAYLNWIFLDDQFNYVSSLSGAVPAASSTYTPGTLWPVAPGAPLIITRSGYLYVWVSNETQGWDVFFDNLSISDHEGPLLEENHYYPFGLTMQGISDKAIKTNYAENKYRYNQGTELQNKEFNDGSGWEMYETGFRSLDPQLGRFTQVDPLTDRYQFFSAYQFAANNPVSINDPTGALLPSPQQQKMMNTTTGNFDDVNEGFSETDANSSFVSYNEYLSGQYDANGGGNDDEIDFHGPEAQELGSTIQHDLTDPNTISWSLDIGRDGDGNSYFQNSETVIDADGSVHTNAIVVTPGIFEVQFLWWKLTTANYISTVKYSYNIDAEGVKGFIIDDKGNPEISTNVQIISTFLAAPLGSSWYYNQSGYDYLGPQAGFKFTPPEQSSEVGIVNTTGTLFLGQSLPVSPFGFSPSYPDPTMFITLNPFVIYQIITNVNLTQPGTGIVSVVIYLLQGYYPNTRPNPPHH